ncbi:MAG: hypothetical protein P0S95_05735 [Rhabdochlamydiaceae bacterium]|nr:hypothetical protein [Candidatus Amphrikana amoebophyrae]
MNRPEPVGTTLPAVWSFLDNVEQFCIASIVANTINQLINKSRFLLLTCKLANGHYQIQNSERDSNYNLNHARRIFSSGIAVVPTTYLFSNIVLPYFLILSVITYGACMLGKMTLSGSFPDFSNLLCFYSKDDSFYISNKFKRNLAVSTIAQYYLSRSSELISSLGLTGAYLKYREGINNLFNSVFTTIKLQDYDTDFDTVD